MLTYCLERIVKLKTKFLTRHSHGNQKEVKSLVH